MTFRDESRSRMDIPSAVRAARRAAAVAFLINGMALATLVSRIPAIKQGLGASDGQLGLALLGMAVGAILAFAVAGPLIARFGSRRVTALGGAALCVATPLVATAASPLTLGMLLALFGASKGAMDVAMNAQAVEVERRYGRPVMSSLHGLFSLGGLIGAALGGLMAGLDVSLALHFGGVGVLLGLLLLLSAPHLLPAQASGASRGPAFVLPTRALLGLGVIAVCAFVIEGAMADWSAVYLRGTLGTGAAYAATGYAAFSLAMTLTRFGGDAIAARLGAERVVRWGGLLAAVGVGLALGLGRPAFALVGFACVGLGMAIVVPLVFSAAGRTPGVAPGAAIAAVATMGYGGFLTGPPTLGFLAEAVTLRVALGVLALLGLLIALLSRNLRQAAPTDREGRVVESHLLT